MSFWKTIVNFFNKDAEGEKILDEAIKDAEITLDKFEADEFKPIPMRLEATRARNKKGQYEGDDESTPDINEAWVGGKTPTKKLHLKKGKLSRNKRKRENSAISHVYSRE